LPLGWQDAAMVAQPVASQVVLPLQRFDRVAARGDRVLLQLGVRLAGLPLQVLGQLDKVGGVGRFVGDEPGHGFTWVQNSPNWVTAPTSHRQTESKRP
jgi:hypothetical protein